MQLRTCRTLDGLIEILRERRDALDLTNENLEAISGISDGYAAKLLSPAPTRRLGAMSLDALLGALALRVCTVTITDDEVLAAVMAPKWKPRRGRPRKQKRLAPPGPRPGFPCAWDLVFFVPAAEPEPRKPAAAPLVRCCERQTEFSFPDTGEADMAKTISVRVDTELEERVTAAAARERRPISQYLRNVLNDVIAKPQPDADGADPKSEAAA